jgi:hypothetical protein
MKLEKSVLPLMNKVLCELSAMDPDYAVKLLRVRVAIG